MKENKTKHRALSGDQVSSMRGWKQLIIQFVFFFSENFVALPTESKSPRITCENANTRAINKIYILQWFSLFSLWTVATMIGGSRYLRLWGYSPLLYNIAKRFTLARNRKRNDFNSSTSDTTEGKLKVPGPAFHRSIVHNWIFYLEILLYSIFSHQCTGNYHNFPQLLPKPNIHN